MADEKTAPEPPQPVATPADAEEWDEAWLPEWIAAPDEPVVEEPTPEADEPAEPEALVEPEAVVEPETVVVPEAAVVPEPEQGELESGQDDEPSEDAEEPAEPVAETPAAYVPPRVVVRPRVRPHRRARNTVLVGLFVAAALVGAALLATSWGTAPASDVHATEPTAGTTTAAPTTPPRTRATASAPPTTTVP